MIGLLMALVMLLGAPQAFAQAAPPDAPAAAPASALREPHSFYMWCRSPTGLISYPSTPADCRNGQIKFLDTYDGSVVGSMDMYALEHSIVGKGKSWDQAYAACNSHIICGTILVLVYTFAISKLKVGYVFLKALIG
jgi:hypothetical protein